MEFYKDHQEIPSSIYDSDNIESEFINTTKIAKRKRTRRRRQHHTRPGMTALSAESASTSATTARVLLTQDQAAPAESVSTSAATSSARSIITEEEEDMANCLMLLAQGGLRSTEWKEKSETLAKDDTGVSTEKFTSRRLADGKAGLYVYECKTCNKCFPSFQALGGHRTSHKKPKLGFSEDNKQIVNEDMLQMSMNSFSKPLFSNSLKPKVHECSICGAEFNSGQALGGHMRRHRPLVAAAVADHQGQELVANDKEKNMFSLDLNLPASAFDDELRQPEAAAFDFVTPWLAISY